ncbi:hypothetical protein K432DRAFT_332851 [Lepidopterella palustris CBS 459.81]|uniref:S1 motif domain-containing protein n=1 Tax=Lepidopterella palustris CBS 459.81 TaxID=1314670 RepID=A0A8E2JD38_9PEZI|nr:hypothetical protein K432DRAFT_332851 [Lepidopterella palustris CBS 459.81]
MSLPTIALPGQLLGPTSKYAPGPGTHIHDSQIYASIPGPVVSTSPSITKRPITPFSTPSAHLPTLSITRHAPSNNSISFGNGRAGTSILPEVDSTVLARVTRLGQRFATVEILVVGDKVCREGFQGLIRKEDVRATEKDRVKIPEMFRVGDVVRGVVISLGDQANYYISTAKNELGVVMAVSELGNQMYPVSWREFRDPKTGAVEGRKVAKPF